MTPGYADGGAFRQALEARLRRVSDEGRVPLNTLRQKVVMERLLARLFVSADPGWRLKGGYAMELRLANRARTTRDLDLAATSTDSKDAHAALWERLQDASARDLGDFLVFAVAAGEPLAEDGPGGFRFPVQATLGGRPYAGFHVDVGLDAEPGGAAEAIVCDDHMGFAGVAPARELVVPRERQFSEKLHAYTRPWGDRVNTRTKDLVDLLLLIELGLAGEPLRAALREVFGRDGSHPPPEALPAPPAEWAEDYGSLARQTGLADRTLDEGFARLKAFWATRRLGE